MSSSRSSKSLCRNLWFLLSFLLCLASAPLARSDALVVESVKPGSPAEQAGLRADDRLLEADGKPLRTPADWFALQKNAPGKDTVALKVIRGQVTLTFDLSLTAPEAGVEVRPDFPVAVLTLYEQGRQASVTKDAETAITKWREAAKAARASGDTNAADWLYSLALPVMEQLRPDSAEFVNLLWEAADCAWRRRCAEGFEHAQQLLSRCLAIRERLVPDSELVVDCLLQLGLVSVDGLKWQEAIDYSTRALPIAQHVCPNSRKLAFLYYRLGYCYSELRDLDAALHHATIGLALSEKVVQDSEPTTSLIGLLGRIFMQRGDLESADRYLLCAVKLMEQVKPNSREFVGCLIRLGAVAQGKRDVTAAQDYLRRAVKLMEQIKPNSLELADCLMLVGAVTWGNGKLHEAFHLNAVALQLVERLSPNSMKQAELYQVAASRYWHLSDCDMAQHYADKALALVERLDPGGTKAIELINLQGNIHASRRDLDAAEKCFRRVLSMEGTLGSDHLMIQEALAGMGSVATYRKNYQSAIDYLQKSARILERTDPKSPRLVWRYHGMGGAALSQGNIELAREYYTKAYSLGQRGQGAFMVDANTLASLGILELKGGNASGAVPLLSRAADLAEVQRQEVQSPETKERFSDRLTWIFISLMQAHVETNNLPAALAAVERGRTRGLVEMLRERALSAEAEVPKELLSRKQELDNRRDALYQELGTLDANKDADRIEKLRKDVEAVQAEQRRLTEEIRKASPRYAALQYPKPLTLNQIQELLEPGTLCLEYAITLDETFLFTVTKTDLKLHRIPVQSEELRDRVEHFRQLLSSPNRDAAKLGKQLYDLLLRPARAEIKQAKRVLICPTGSLHLLPFGALVPKLATGKKTSQLSEARYFVEDKPLHVIGSMSLYAGLREDALSATSSTRTLLALGDPVYDAASESGKKATTEFEVRSAKLTPLPFTRHEVETLGGLYGKEAFVRLGKEATESAVKEEGNNASVLHLACHGLLNDDDPLASALALTPSEATKDDGLLRAYEVMDKLRLNADLVVLSACQSGLGKVSSSEGIVGMTRAFLYAGAKSVVVSLWNVADESTAQLMAEFHRQLKAVKSKDEALRLAQISLLRPLHLTNRNPKSFAHPFFWAPFMLVGDWR